MGWRFQEFIPVLLFVTLLLIAAQQAGKPLNFHWSSVGAIPNKQMAIDWTLLPPP